MFYYYREICGREFKFCCRLFELGYKVMKAEIMGRFNEDYNVMVNSEKINWYHRRSNVISEVSRKPMSL